MNHPVINFTTFLIKIFIICPIPATLVYVFYNCCQPGCSRLLHLMFHLMSVSCVTIGTMSAWDMDSLTSSHMVTMHAWCGAATLALIAVQVQYMISILGVIHIFIYSLCLD